LDTYMNKMKKKSYIEPLRISATLIPRFAEGTLLCLTFFSFSVLEAMSFK